MFGRKRQPEPKELALNITSLMDILTIVLIFLISSFSTDEQEITPPNFSIPNSNAQRPVKIALKVSISEDDIKVEDKLVTKLVKGEIRASQMNKQRQVTPLLQELQRKKAEISAGVQTEEDEKDNELIYLEAAKGTPYDLVQRVLSTAAAAGFAKFRLVVWKKG